MPLPSSVQWNVGSQIAIGHGAVLDVSYTGQHSYSTISGVNINNIDLGSAYLSKFADPTQATPTPANSYVSSQPNLVRYYRGYSTITQQQSIGWRTYHSIQLAVTRRMRNGLSFGANDTIQLSDKQFVAPRLQHNDDGTITIRSDQATAQELFGNNPARRGTSRARTSRGTCLTTGARTRWAGWSASSSTTGACPASGMACRATPTT